MQISIYCIVRSCIGPMVAAVECSGGGQVTIRVVLVPARKVPNNGIAKKLPLLISMCTRMTTMATSPFDRYACTRRPSVKLAKMHYQISNRVCLYIYIYIYVYCLVVWN
jgi:hypothetical protein